MSNAITYTEVLTGISAEHLRGGFFQGWPNPPSPDAHLRIFQGSYAVVLAIDEANRNVVGFITSISDGVSSAYIPFLEVLPAYRKRGIGAELVRRMLARLQHLYMIDLVCDPDLQPFYANLGLQPYSAMIARNYDRQACD